MGTFPLLLLILLLAVYPIHAGLLFVFQQKAYRLLKIGIVGKMLLSYKTVLFAFLLFSQLLAAYYYFKLYGEAIFLIAAFSFGIPLLFTCLPLILLLYDLLGILPRQRWWQIILGGQSLLWLIALILYRTSDIASLSGIRLPFSPLAKDIVAVLFLINYLLQLLLAVYQPPANLSNPKNDGEITSE